MITVEYLRGDRRGQRLHFPVGQSVTFGRHPDCDVAFDARRELDASSRHAELRCTDENYTLCDVGSSNGTFVDGRRVTEIDLVAETPLTVEFGSGGPRLRLLYGDPASLPPLPDISTIYGRLDTTSRVVFAIAVAAVLAIAAIAWVALV
ncbi:MAG: FHA domain-containing protein [Myxococcota bacterium]